MLCDSFEYGEVVKLRLDRRQPTLPLQLVGIWYLAHPAGTLFRLEGLPAVFGYYQDPINEIKEPMTVRRLTCSMSLL